jgi:hypothetical protein
LCRVTSILSCIFVSTAAAKESEAQTAKDAAKDARDSAQLDFDYGTEQIDEEKEALLNIQEVLRNMETKSDRRRLLAMVKVDPAALESIAAIIVDLIETGEDERDQLSTNLKSTKVLFAEAGETFTGTVNEHVRLNGELDSKKDAEIAAKSLAEGATVTKDEADKAKGIANTDLEEKTTTKEEVTTRVDEENGTLSEVRKMLEDLL